MTCMYAKLNVWSIIILLFYPVCLVANISFIKCNQSVVFAVVVVDLIIRKWHTYYIRDLVISTWRKWVVQVFSVTCNYDNQYNTLWTVATTIMISKSITKLSISCILIHSIQPAFCFDKPNFHLMNSVKWGHNHIGLLHVMINFSLVYIPLCTTTC